MVSIPDEEVPMSSIDLEKYVGLNRIYLLESLRGKVLTNIVRPFIIILYETVAQNNGHWVALMRYFVENQEYIEFFDSYGMSPGELYAYNDLEQNIYLNQDQNYLGIMIWNHLQANPSCKFIYNQIQYQKYDEDIATCGHWTLLRIKALVDKHRTLEEFQKQLSKVGKNIDKDKQVSEIF